MRQSHRGRGIGQPQRGAQQLARRRGLEKVELELFASNEPAIRLYEAEGLRVEGRKRRTRKLDGIYDDSILMARFLQGS